MKKIIKLTESDLEKIVRKVLKESSLINEIESDADDLDGSQETINTEITNFNQNAPSDQKQNMKLIQSKLKELGYNLGMFGPNKDGVDGNYGRRTLMAIKDFQRKNGIKQTGWVGTVTAPLLGAEPMKGVTFVGKQGTRKKPVTTQPIKIDPITKKPIPQPIKIDPITKKPKTNTNSTKCIGLPKEMCSKISSTQEVELGSGNEAQCAAYVTKCLSQYDKDFKAGNAWQSAGWLSARGGSEKFNLFKTTVDWDKIWQGLKTNKITKSDCNAFYGKQNSDVGTFKSKSNAILSLTQENAPDSSAANWRSLKPGDVVGLWHSSTSNKGRAFCERLVDDLKLDDKGNFKKLPFTFNTHVGFVTAIKDGIPIIAHNIGNSFHTSGNYSSVPVTKMLSKGSPDRVVWAYSDPQVESSVQKILNTEPKNNNISDLNIFGK